MIMAEKNKTVKKVVKKDTTATKVAPKKEVNVETKEKTYSIRGNVFEGKVVLAKANKTVAVERVLTHYVPKYERYKKVKSKINVHNPASINAKEGDIVQIGETRKISKTKNFIVIKIIRESKPGLI